MGEDTFLQDIQEEVRKFSAVVASPNGDWVIKGFIDVYRRIYTISVDTKVVSKILELLLLPELLDFAERYDYRMVLSPEQNFYPDMSFVSGRTGKKYALDIKSTYRVNATTVNGLTLGAFTGYFRNRSSNKNTVFPYRDYSEHIVLGCIYSRAEDRIDERRVHELQDIEMISSVIRDFAFFAQPKYRIASARPGSGNTKNIGSVTSILQLLEGSGPFAALGEAVYDDYWMSYLTRDMARAIDMERPYMNLKTYAEHKNRGSSISEEQAGYLDSLDTGATRDDADSASST